MEKYTVLNGIKAKYIHILWRSYIIFSPRLINSINNNPDCFSKEEHLLVTNMPELCDMFPDEKLVYIHTSKRQPASLINYCAEHCDYVFVHCMCSPLEVMKIRKKNLGKIIWRTWGGDTSYLYRDGQVIKNFVKRILNFCVRNHYRSVRAICVANVVDEINIKRLYGIDKIYYWGYGNSDIREKLDSIKAMNRTHTGYNICVGHSGYLNDNHINIFNRLMKYTGDSGNNIQIYVPIVYGDTEYMKRIREHGVKCFGSNIHFITKMMPYEEYAQLLYDMDLVILDGEESYALGNIAILIYFQKNIALNKKGIIREGFDKERLPYLTTEKLGEVSFEDISKPFDYSAMSPNCSLLPSSPELRKPKWKEILSDLS